MSRLSVLKQQLHWPQFAKHVGAESTRRLLNPAGVTSYAQSGEDLLIASLLSWPTRGFYVDVGCHFPLRRSNTYLLYLRGLSGICIDANAEFADQFAMMRPRDKFIRACVGDSGGEVEFNIFNDRALSNINGSPVADLSEHQYELERVERLPIRPVSDVLFENHAPEEFDVLSIDVEQHDFSALRSVGLERYRPRLIVIEIHDVKAEYIGQHEVAEYCLTFGYRPVACQRSNVFFMAKK